MSEIEAPPKSANLPPHLLRPARKQVKPGEVERKETPQTGKEYNIWYNKWAGGDREDSYSNKVKSQTRCNIKRDAGYTRANTTGVKYCCLFFARGSCPYGHECNYLHDLPPPASSMPESSKDCFARDKFADYRDDMGGVGSFSRQNRTLYIGRIKETGPGHETEEIVRRHFKMWGEIIFLRVLQHRSVAFVTYADEANAQFAKEAMACQSLDNDEILNVRWATEDPNPESKLAEKRRLEDIGSVAIANKLDPRMVDAVRHIRALEDEEAVPEPASPPEKRQRLEPQPEPEPEPGPEPPNGILSAQTLEGIKYLAEMRRQQEKALQSKPAAPRPPATGLGGLGGYASDEDSD
ncbi:Pre-mRNA-splicing factor [Ceratobasidium theobromae]|uniref:Pre-mRNA-splicing factor n=1 Tax=Ceratobasidium theobromae TaxID=1582974 RepID=A0A5N5QQE2_9AGAM|nr:Pre-mRNA-splicing factor [Ceratobasidium theobromae]